MNRSGKVQDLLYEDAQRRIEQQKMIESALSKKAGGTYSLGSEKQSKLNNKLICNKLRT